MSSGTLQIQLYVAQQAFPVSGALVTVSGVEKGKILFQEKDTVDLDGKSKIFSLETPPFDLSLNEENN